ncbi:hypothetical protein EDB80DRAFT_731049 [Ilyonectria destructans]|nr:hypothetical protein EDB80DRAFT_731049 [Ilyonectria destructans]
MRHLHAKEKEVAVRVYSLLLSQVSNTATYPSFPAEATLSFISIDACAIAGPAGGATTMTCNNHDAARMQTKDAAQKPTQGRPVVQKPNAISAVAQKDKRRPVESNAILPYSYISIFNINPNSYTPLPEKAMSTWMNCTHETWANCTNAAPAGSPLQPSDASSTDDGGVATIIFGAIGISLSAATVLLAWRKARLAVRPQSPVELEANIELV